MDERPSSTWTLASAIGTGLNLCLCAPAAFGLAILVTESVDDEIGALTMILGAAVLIVVQLVLFCGAIFGFVRREPLAVLGIATFTLGLIAILGLMVFGGAAMSEFF